MNVVSPASEPESPILLKIYPWLVPSPTNDSTQKKVIKYNKSTEFLTGNSVGTQKK